MAALDFSLSSLTIEAEISVTELISYRTSCLWVIDYFVGKFSQMVAPLTLGLLPALSPSRRLSKRDSGRDYL